ncbi:hypothetical protein Tco_0946518, partial [Tanacetum coccineum]
SQYAKRGVTGDSMERAATTAISLDAEQGSGVNTPGSGEDRLKIMELMEICTKLSDKVLALENVKTAQDLEITSLKKRVTKLEKKKKARTPQLKRRLFKDIDVTIASAPITTAGVSVSTAEPSTPPTTTTVIEDEDLIIAQTLIKMRSEKSKEKAKERGSKENSSEPDTRLTRGMTMQEPSESGTRQVVPPSQHDPKDKGKAKMIEPEKPLKKKDQIKFDEEVAKRLAEELEAELEEEERVAIQREEEANLISWDNTQAMMEADYELAQRLQAEEHGELTIEERSRLFVELMNKRKKHFAKLRAEKIRRKPPTKAQQRNHMSTYLRNMAGYKHIQLKNKSFKEIQMLFDKEMKRVNSFVPMDSEVVEGSGKKTKSSRKETVSKKRAEIVPRDDEAINVETLSTKYPIVDWKTHILTEDKMYYEIIRADGSTKFYKIFTAMLDDFDRQNVLDLYRLLLLVVMKITTAGEDCRKYSKLLLLLVVKLLLLVLVTTARRVSAVRLIDTELFTHDIERTKTYEDYESKLNNEVGEPWSKDGVPYEICNHICKPFRFKNGKAKWPTCSSNEDGFYNGEELPGMVQVGYMTYFQDYEWDHICGPYENYYSNVQDEVEQEDNERCILIDDREPPICNIIRFEMIMYSFGHEEEYVAIKEYEYDDLTRTNDDACHAYQEIFRNMDKGWLVTRLD